MASFLGRRQKFIPGATAVALIAVLFVTAFNARLPTASGDTRDDVAARYEFTEMPIAMPPGYHPTQTIRQVNPAFYHIRSWISAVGAAIALNDLQGKGRPDDLCIVDTRTDEVVVTYAPTAPAQDRFTPFLLDPAPTLPMDAAMAPMGCTPGDFNGDGRMDVLVTYWGRTPVLFMARPDVATLSPQTYRPVELVAQESYDGRYHGPRWNTNAVSVDDYDGDGHPDILIANYFPDSDVINPNGQKNVEMNASMSNAKNGGGAHVFRWHDATTGAQPTARYVEVAGAVPYRSATGWTLAASGADLTGDGRPELYLANDFGRDHLFYNASTAGTIKFTEAKGSRGPRTPKSFALQNDSFKGMGVDFGDLDRRGRFDMVVSNITTGWAFEESNFAWMNEAADEADMHRKLVDGVAPFTQRAQERGLAWTGWGWDVKMGDFLNSGNLEILQAEGFIQGKVNRWPWLQEMAMVNDNIFTDPAMWPNVQPGDDISGHEPMAFYARSSAGADFVNLTRELGLDDPTPSRGIATADTRGVGALDFAVARQWGPPAFYANNSPDRGRYLSLDLTRPGGAAAPGGPPAYGASVRISTPAGGTQLSQLDGGSGHSGKRSFEVRFGLGSYDGPVRVDLRWRDGRGELRRQTLELSPGQHSLTLDTTAQEVPSR
jgi:hypothetical protein